MEYNLGVLAVELTMCDALQEQLETGWKVVRRLFPADRSLVGKNFDPVGMNATLVFGSPIRPILAPNIG